MIDDLLEHLFEDSSFRLSTPRRIQLLFRLFFGLLGGALGVAGAVYLGSDAKFTSNAILRFAAVMMFLGLAAFFLCNVALGRKWRWPGWLFVTSFAGLFVSRIALGP